MTIAADASTLRDEIASRLITARERTHGLTDCVETQLHPVVSELRWARHQELVRLGRNERVALLLREREAHDRLVA